MKNIAILLPALRLALQPEAAREQEDFEPGEMTAFIDRRTC